MAKRITVSRIIAQASTRAAGRLRRNLMTPFRPLTLSVGKPQVFFDGRSRLKLGKKVTGAAVLSGEFSHFGQSLNVGCDGDPWRVAAPSERFAEWLHGFSWMEDLCVLTDKSAPVRARALVDGWIAEFGDFNPYAWQVDRLSQRLFYWLSLWAPALSTDSLGDAARTRRIATVRQMAYLRKHYRETAVGFPRFRAALVITLGGARLPDKNAGYLDRGMDWLDDEIEAQILADGGHVTRSPETTVQALEALLTLDSILDARGIARSKAVGRAIDRLSPIVAFFTAGDGGLCVFNGGGEYDVQRLTKLKKSLDVTARTFGYCPHTGYQRIAQNGTVLMVDSGSVPPPPFDGAAHLAPLAFELSTEAGRIITSCGWSDEQPRDWHLPSRATAAHSTLVLNDTSAGRLVETGLKQKLFGHAVDVDTGSVKVQRKEQVTGTWLEGTNDGYRDTYGLTHRRRYYMALDGHDIRGEDSLFVPLGATPVRRDSIPFAIRFHLHPSVKVTLAQDQKSALLIQAGRVGWRLRTDGGPLSIEPSFYLGRGHRPTKTEQIVIRGEAFADSDGETRSNRVRWSLRKLEARKADSQKPGANLSRPTPNTAPPTVLS